MLRQILPHNAENRIFGQGDFWLFPTDHTLSVVRWLGRGLQQQDIKVIWLNN